jgi:hypothetical protein
MNLTGYQVGDITHRSFYFKKDLFQLTFKKVSSFNGQYSKKEKKKNYKEMSTSLSNDVITLILRFIFMFTTQIWQSSTYINVDAVRKHSQRKTKTEM